MVLLPWKFSVINSIMNHMNRYNQSPLKPTWIQYLLVWKWFDSHWSIRIVASNWFFFKQRNRQPKHSTGEKKLDNLLTLIWLKRIQWNSIDSVHLKRWKSIERISMPERLEHFPIFFFFCDISLSTRVDESCHSVRSKRVQSTSTWFVMRSIDSLIQYEMIGKKVNFCPQRDIAHLRPLGERGRKVKVIVHFDFVNGSQRCQRGQYQNCKSIALNMASSMAYGTWYVAAAATATKCIQWRLRTNRELACVCV